MSAAPAGRRELFLVFGVALALRLGAMLALGTPAAAEGLTPWRWGTEPACIADALARGDGFSDPWGRDTGPTGWLTPLYPALLALLMELFDGVGARTAAALFTLQALASAATCVVLFRLGERLGRPRAGRVGAWLFALHPVGAWNAIQKVWDTTFVAAGLAAFLLAVVTAGRAPSAKRSAMLGAAFGLLLMLNPAPVGILPAVLLYLVPLGVPLGVPPGATETAKGAAVRAGAFCGAALLVCAPWMARNLAVLGTPGLRSNLGVELRVGNNELSDGMHRFEYHPAWTDAVTERLRELGEVAFAAEAGAHARDWIAANPLRFLWITLRRAQIFWLGELPLLDRREEGGVQAAEDPKTWLRWAAHLASGVLGAAGAWILARRRADAWLVRGVLLLFPLPYYLTHALERYRFPIDPLLALGAGAVAVAAWERWRTRSHAATSDAAARSTTSGSIGKR